MNAILLIAHAPLANALRQCALHVFPDCGAMVMAIDVQRALPQGVGERRVGDQQDGVHGAFVRLWLLLYRNQA